MATRERDFRPPQALETIEPLIGHLKNDGCYLLGMDGDVFLLFHLPFMLRNTEKKRQETFSDNEKKNIVYLMKYEF